MPVPSDPDHLDIVAVFGIVVQEIKTFQIVNRSVQHSFITLCELLISAIS